MKFGDEKEGHSSQKPMSYSESVKKAKPRSINDKEATRQAIARGKEQAKILENCKIERNKVKQSLEVMKREFNRLKGNYNETVARKKAVIDEKNLLINGCLLIADKRDSASKENNDKFSENSACPATYKRLNVLNESITNKIVDTKRNLVDIKDSYLSMKERNHTRKDLIDLMTINWNYKDKRVNKKKLERLYEDKKATFEKLQKEVKDAEKLAEESCHTKQDDFMVKRIGLLTEQVENRVSDVNKINEKLYEAETNYEEKNIFLENLQEQCKELRKELSEPILNRRQFNLCLKENFSYDARLREVLEQRERIQFDYGALMEEMKVMKDHHDVEEKTKEKLFMSIMAQIDEGQQYRMECENILARISQMHAEIFVRHGFMHAKETAIGDLTKECKELEESLNNAAAKELSLQCENKALQKKLTEILFDVCFAMSWKAVGSEKEHDSAFDDDDGDDDSCEVLDLDEIETRRA